MDTVLPANILIAEIDPAIKLSQAANLGSISQPASDTVEDHNNFSEIIAELAGFQTLSQNAASNNETSLTEPLVLGSANSEITTQHKLELSTNTQSVPLSQTALINSNDSLNASTVLEENTAIVAKEILTSTTITPKILTTPAELSKIELISNSAEVVSKGGLSSNVSLSVQTPQTPVSTNVTNLNRITENPNKLALIGKGQPELNPNMTSRELLVDTDPELSGSHVKESSEVISFLKTRGLTTEPYKETLFKQDVAILSKGSEQIHVLDTDAPTTKVQTDNIAPNLVSRVQVNPVQTQLAQENIPGQKSPLLNNTEQVAQQIEMHIQSKDKSARIQLDPPSLGRVQVQIKMDGDQVSVEMKAVHGMAREALLQELPKLKELLQEQGIELSGMDVEVGGGNKQFSQTHDAESYNSSLPEGMKSSDSQHAVNLMLNLPANQMGGINLFA